ARAAILERKHLPGLGFYPEERRFYPQGSLASQVLGYAGVDNRGLAGLELSLDRELAGRPGRERTVTDASGEVTDTSTSRTVRAAREVEAPHRRRLAVGKPRLPVDQLRAAVPDPRRRPDHPRRGAARDGDDDRGRDPGSLVQCRRDHAGRAARAAPAGRVDLA